MLQTCSACKKVGKGKGARRAGGCCNRFSWGGKGRGGVGGRAELPTSSEFCTYAIGTLLTAREPGMLYLRAGAESSHDALMCTALFCLPFLYLPYQSTFFYTVIHYAILCYMICPRHNRDTSCQATSSGSRRLFKSHLASCRVRLAEPLLQPYTSKEHLRLAGS